MFRIFDKEKRDNLEFEFLPPALEIEETPPSPLRRYLIWIIFAIVVFAFGWSYFGKVEIVAEARGKIIPDGRVKVIQPMEEGIIKAIHVIDGQHVKAGQILIDLDPTINRADVDSNVRNLSLHQMDKQRLVEELSGKSGDSPGTASKKSPDGIVGYQEQLLSARESEYKARFDAQRLVVAQKESALQSAIATLNKLEKTSVILTEEEEGLRKLHRDGYASRMEWRDKEREAVSTLHDLESQKKNVQQAREGLEESRHTLDAIRNERNKSILSDIMDREKNITSLGGEVTKSRKRYELERLVSPVEGTVHGLSMFTIGGIVKPAQDVVSVVPDDTVLVVEATVLNKDVGFLKVGQPAEVKLDAFPFQKYGTIKGKVLFISPDAIDDEKLGPVYKTRISLEKATIIVDGRNVALSPGMSTSVEVKTGMRRVIEFFLSPIVKYARESLVLR
jgi:hemolysin D